LTTLEFWMFVLTAIGSLGGVATILVWLEVRPRHVKAWFIRGQAVGSEVAVADPSAPQSTAQKKTALVVAVVIFAITFSASAFSLYWSFHTARLSPKQWMVERGKLEHVYNRNFGPDDVIELDGKNIHDCNFIGSTIIYRGNRPFYWNHNSMQGNIKVKFLDGPAFSGSALLRIMMEAYPCVPAGNNGGTCSIDVIDQDGKSLGPHP
jgi:hypothetical protein